MKVFNLKCEHGHSFEGWFKSHVAYEDQQARGLLSCPFCESRVIEKTLSAPRPNLSGAQLEVAEATTAETGAADQRGVAAPQQTPVAVHPQGAALAHLLSCGG